MIADIRVHWHFHKKCYSIVDRKTGLVIEHTTGPIFMEEVRFVVQPGGRARVLRENRKNVHSYIRGTRIPDWPKQTRKRYGSSFQRGLPMTVYYDPYKAGHWWFYRPDNPVDEATLVELTVGDHGAPIVKTYGLHFCEKEAA